MKEKTRKKIGLALGSGGWRGLAHIGVIKALVEHNISIDYIAGSSVGALVGGLYAYYGDITKLEDIVSGFTYRKLIKTLYDPAIRKGLIKGQKIIKFLKEFVGETDIGELSIPFYPVVTDLRKGELVVLKNGSLATGIRASGSIPLIMQPIEIDGNIYVDGGTISPVPVDVVKSMGADIVIGVNLYGNIFPLSDKTPTKIRLTTTEITRLSYQLMLKNLAEQELKRADIVVNPIIPEGKFDIFFKFVKQKDTDIYGYNAMIKMIPELEKLIY